MLLAIIGTTGIQPYIFGSNTLAENIGASYLVAQATGPWALDCVREVFGTHNVTEGGALERARRIEEHALDAEVLYAGGGNVQLLCRDAERWAAFERCLSKKALAEAPGLQLVTAHRPVALGAEPLSAAVDALIRELFTAKRAWPPSAPLLGLGVTRACRSTGLPAVGFDRDGAPFSAEILAKQHAAGDAHDALVAKIAPPDGFAYPKDFDALGRTEGDASYLAVVHADGNGMGQRIRRLGTHYSEEALGPDAMRAQNRAYVDALRAFSGAVEEAARQAQQTILDRLAGCIDRDEGVITYAVEDPSDGTQKEITRLQLRLASDTGDEHPEWYLPFRPLVFGGDDLTFVCDGRLGIALALDYMAAFEDETERRKEQCGGAALTASAGVAIVKTHYPFSRAYRLAEALTASAKRLRRRARAHAARQGRTWEGACLDWHFALGGLAGSLDLIRRREYRAQRQPGDDAAQPPLSLTLRPVSAGPPPPAVAEAPALHPAQRWDVVARGIARFQEDWVGRRSKVKRLRAALRGGPAQVQAFTDAFGELPDLALKDVDERRLRTAGWAANRCAYFDAIELADFFIPVSHLRGTPHASPTDATE